MFWLTFCDMVIKTIILSVISSPYIRLDYQLFHLGEAAFIKKPIPFLKIHKYVR